MSIEKVTATLENDTEELIQQNGLYSGELQSPQTVGQYDVSVSAYDDSGNITTDVSSLTVSSWIPPKTNWKSTDRFNFSDYNRIKNNIKYLHEKAVSLWNMFEIEDMGENIYDYTHGWDAEKFNIFERNIDAINQNIFTKDYGYMQQFYHNGLFIKYDELNRIESATLSMNNILENQILGLRRLSFRLGNFKEVKV